MKRPGKPYDVILAVHRPFRYVGAARAQSDEANRIQKVNSRSGLSALACLALSVILTSFTFLYSIDDVASAMRSGNAADIAKFFDTRVDLTFPDKSSNYSKSQAEMILKDFFSTNQVKGFVVKHKGENKDGSQFCIGVLQTKVRDYRARFYLKKKGDQQYLQEITFEVPE
jgi:hypothetical protein